MDWFNTIFSAVQWAIANGRDIKEMFDDIRDTTGGHPENFTMEQFEAIKASRQPVPPTVEELREEAAGEAQDPEE